MTAESLPPEPGSGRLSLPLVAVALALSGFTISAWLMRAAGISAANDDAVYFFLARSLEEGSFRNTFLPGAPFHGLYPPGWPAVIALISVIAGESVTAVTLVVLGSVVAALLLLHHLLRSRLGEAEAAIVILLLSINPYLIAVAGQPLSDGPFFLLAVIALWAVIRSRESARYAWIAIAAGLASFTLRTAGVAVMGFVAVGLAFERRWRQVVVAVVVAGVATGSWLWWAKVAEASEVERSYLRALLADEPAERFRRFVRYLNTVHSLLGFPRFRESRLDNAAFLLVMFGLGGLGVVQLWRRCRAFLGFAALYTSLLLVYPWGLPRYFLPLVPTLLTAIVLGARRVTSSVRPAWQGLALAAVVLMFAPRHVKALRDEFLVNRACDRAAPLESTGCWPDARQRGFLRLARWSASLPASTVVGTPHEASFAYYSGGKTVGVNAETDPRRIEDLIAGGVRYFVAVRRPPRIDGLARSRQSLMTICDRLTLVRGDLDQAYLFVVTPASAGSCDLLRDGRW